jgi:predicted dehydrogenase
MDLSGQTGYADVAGLLADPRVDLVDLCVPNDEHAPLAIRALEAGKHVLVEKPIALTTRDADAMVAAAKAAGKLLMVAHVLPFFPEFAFAADAVKSGRYGALKAASLKRVIAKPDWSRGISDLDRSGGPAIDLHIHDTHYIGLVCGVPRAVQSCGVVDQGAVVHLSTQYLYDESHLAVSAVSGALSQAGRPFTHGFEFYLDGATLAFEFANLAGEGHVAMPLSVILPDGTVERPELGSGDPIDSFAAELTVAVAAAASGTPPAQLSGELARQALKICHAEVESVKTGKPVAID